MVINCFIFQHLVPNKFSLLFILLHCNALGPNPPGLPAGQKMGTVWRTITFYCVLEMEELARIIIPLYFGLVFLNIILFRCIFNVKMCTHSTYLVSAKKKNPSLGKGGDETDQEAFKHLGSKSCPVVVFAISSILDCGPVLLRMHMTLIMEMLLKALSDGSGCGNFCKSQLQKYKVSPLPCMVLGPCILAIDRCN